MDTTKIKAFLLAEKYGSFSKVAEAFSYTPSALSHMADSLEEELGVKLFVRNHRGVVLTQAGQQLRGKFEAVLEAETALLSEAEKLSCRQEETLRIGAFSSVALHLLPMILRSFKKENPGVKTSVLVEDSWQENDLDMIFTDSYCPDAKTAWYPILKEPYVVAAPEGLMPNKTAITRDELYALPFIQTSDEVLDDYFQYGKFQETVKLRSIENETAVSMVKEKLGVAVLPALTVQNGPVGVRVLELLPELTRTIGVQYKKKGLSATAQKFLKHLKKEYGKL